jgi:hypothetical protein
LFQADMASSILLPAGPQHPHFIQITCNLSSSGQLTYSNSPFGPHQGHSIGCSHGFNSAIVLVLKIY